MKVEGINKDNNQYGNSNQLNTTVKGVLVDNHLRFPRTFSFNDIQDSLLINNSKKYYSSKTDYKNLENSNFDARKAMLPLLASSSVLMGGSFLLSAGLKKSSASLLKTKNFEHLPDLAINMNIKEETQFAIYRTIRDPNFKNIMGAIGVFIMSGITIACKNFVDGAKEIWIKKQNADIEKNLQQNLINVERDVFSGKLKVVNDMMRESVKYFDSVINCKYENSCLDIARFKSKKTNNIFAPFKNSFKGFNTSKEDKSNNNEKKLNMALIASVLALGALLGKFSYSNLKKTLQNSQKFANNFSENAINAIENISKKQDKKDIQAIIELMKSICAKPEFIRTTAKKYNLSENEIQEIINSVEKTKKTIFADAPAALGGIPQKIQYYCYIDEPRGHLYNWILNPENKFTGYIFKTFTASSAIGYLFQQSMDAIKEVTVMEENAKTELDLKKKLVDIEIESFRSKKESAVLPLIDNFTMQAINSQKSRIELKQIADNILMEIKNGPPYVYN